MIEPDFLAEVLAYIEAHRDEPLTVAELASVAGFSPYHFSRLFTARFGESVLGYVRTCRLQRAALRLTGDAPPALAELAFDCGFESQEAFTRAFRRRYGVPPGQFKREALKQPKPFREIVMPANAKVEMQQGLVARPAFTVAGVGALFNADNKSGIPGLWPRLIRVLPLKGQADARTYGVCKMVDKQEGSLRYIAGVEVEGDAPLPDGFERIELAAHSYAVFRLTVDGSALHPQMQAAMGKIWGELLPQSGLKTVPAPDFELYPSDFEPMRKGSYVDMYIAVEPKA
ncbi:MAG TPA: AraC family transcriptional regulator [Rhizomicrobium sp.]|nr:AraC family transcriptional regulator [Rhizomicrobium sp.]